VIQCLTNYTKHVNKFLAIFSILVLYPWANFGPRGTLFNATPLDVEADEGAEQAAGVVQKTDKIVRQQC
jgi:hypothetical protein